MPGGGIEISYNEELTTLEHALAHVRRAGDFLVQGSVEAPMPRVNVRGAETLVDTSVRRVWQLPLSELDIGGKSWPRTFDEILAAAAEGLGCAGEDVSADLYKRLVYNLQQRSARKSKKRAPLLAPTYGADQVDRADHSVPAYADVDGSGVAKLSWTALRMRCRLTARFERKTRFAKRKTRATSPRR